MKHKDAEYRFCYRFQIQYNICVRKYAFDNFFSHSFCRSKTRKWINDSYYYWDGLRQREDASLSGVMQLSVYCFSSTDLANVRVGYILTILLLSARFQTLEITLKNIYLSMHSMQNHYLEGLLPLYRRCSEDELKICPGDWKYGSFYTTLLTDTRLWQAYAMQRYAWIMFHLSFGIKMCQINWIVNPFFLFGIIQDF